MLGEVEDSGFVGYVRNDRADGVGWRVVLLCGHGSYLGIHQYQAKWIKSVLCSKYMPESLEYQSLQSQQLPSYALCCIQRVYNLISPSVPGGLANKGSMNDRSEM